MIITNQQKSKMDLEDTPLDLLPAWRRTPNPVMRFVDKLTLYAGQSRLVDVHQTCSRMYLKRSAEYTDEPASHTWQSLGHEAQLAVGIKQENIRPILKLNGPAAVSRDGDAYEVEAARATHDGVFVNETELQKHDAIPLEERRAIMFHEAVHYKYNDEGVVMLMRDATLGSTFALGGRLSWSLTKANARTKYIMTYPFCVYMIGIGCTVLVGKKYGKFAERRADIEGFNATQCSKCTASMTKWQRDTGKGYLSTSEIDKIAKDLGDKRCTYCKQV